MISMGSHAQHCPNISNYDGNPYENIDENTYNKEIQKNRTITSKSLSNFLRRSKREDDNNEIAKKRN